MLNVAPSLRLVALTALFGGLLVNAPVYAQTSDAMDNAPAASEQTTDQAATAPGPSTHAMASGAHGEMHVEQRIKTLHDKLKITADQEEQWNKVAETMRDNEANMHKLAEARHDQMNMTAVDDIKSYQQITQAHADGMQKMVAAFEPLYNNLSDAQKKNADEVFGEFQGHHHHGKKDMKKTS